MATMKAVRFHEYGGPEVLRYEDAPKPEPAAGQSLVKIHATSVNPVDWKIRAGYLRGFRDYPLPFIAGWDFSGVVEAVGEGVTRVKPGDEVFGHPDIAKPGTYAEYIAVPEDVCVAKPPAIDHLHAAAIPLTGLTAWQALFDAAGLKAGQKVLIQAGAGGVGSFAVQFAKLKGLTVAATASARNQDYLRELGADQPINYETTRFEDAVNDADAVIEALGGEIRDRSWKTIKKGGILVGLIGPPPKQEDADAHGVRQTLMWVQSNAGQLAEIGELVATGKVKVHLDAVIPLAEMARAHELNASGHTRGKIAIQVV